ncbi:hypothetical protein [Enhygromyxa salina]|uniref:Endo-1,4-beta-xylanase A n=1 Tax=Enhygromyxa salina TaxID=215803 RepID=A0A2S9YTL3_9BACT|nr:hypothetical protein [Enhygromyxa salina]PRQ08428.1 hypothetical protein ENSA7_17130 [Enhygromyxa salina]
MNNKLLSPQIFTLVACLGLALAPLGCAKDVPADDMGSDTSGDGDGDPGDGDGDPTTGDGDGDPTTGDGDGDPTTGDGDGDPMGDAPNGAPCTSNGECLSGNCYVIPLLGGQCGECDNVDLDADCPDGGCTIPNPFENNGSTCNMGEAGGGCQTDEVCQDGLTCGTVLDLLGLIKISTCGECASDADCTDQICAPVVIVENFDGQNTCIDVGSLAQDSFCDLEGNGDEACENVCSTVDIMGLAEVGACGQCNEDADCDGGGTCQGGEFDINSGMLFGSTCVM